MAGLILLGLAVYIVFLPAAWMGIFAVMMGVICVVNLLAWIVCLRTDTSKALARFFKQWAASSFGYTCVLLAISPLIYALKTQSDSIDFGFFTLSPVLRGCYIEIVPGLILGVAMLLSLQRAETTKEKMIELCGTYHKEKSGE